MKGFHKVAIADDAGNEVAFFTYYICTSSNELFAAAELGNDDIRVIDPLTYPAFFLKSLKVNRGVRRMGYGSKALKEFRNRMVSEGASSAFARISDPETSKDDLVRFYTANGWMILGDANYPRFGALIG